MAQPNVDIVTIADEVDLAPVTNPTGTFLHVTQGRKISFTNLANSILALVTGPFVRTLLQMLEGDNRLHASAIRGLSGSGAPTTFVFPETTGATVTVPGLTANPAYIAVYVEKDRYFPSEFTVSSETITFNIPLEAEQGIVDFIL